VLFLTLCCDSNQVDTEHGLFVSLAHQLASACHGSRELASIHCCTSLPQVMRHMDLVDLVLIVPTCSANAQNWHSQPYQFG
jgi:hypothetical protein